MISRSAIQSAYSFFHQKWQVYRYSTHEWQRDDIEYAISDYVSGMDSELYAILSGGRKDFLTDHLSFAADIQSAIEKMSAMLD